MIDPGLIGDILREAATEIIAPRFERLGIGDVSEKSPGEVVTVADQEAEDFITGRLNQLTPGVPVVGEEAVSANPGLLEALETGDAAWLVDPLDGTANYAQGDHHWAVMAALVQHGETITSAIYRHTDQCLYLAERGSGAWHNGERMTAAACGHPAPPALRGAVLTRFLTGEEQATMLPRLTSFQAITAGYQCAGYEYPAIVEGEEDFALFQRTLPWDHAPGVLLLTEAGGTALHPDGTPYRPGVARRGLLLASSPAVWECVHEVLYPGHL
jgi:fructose-1,6-bisphosphatase/inositol monophosphatase family enzyme